MFAVEKLIVPKARVKSHKGDGQHIIFLQKHRCSKKQIDHEGRQFDTVEAMCDYWGVKYSTYLYRIRKGVSVRFALTRRVTQDKTHKQYDHEGRGFKSTMDMCDYWGVNYNTYKTRMRKGVSKKFALTGTV